MPRAISMKPCATSLNGTNFEPRMNMSGIAMTKPIRKAPTVTIKVYGMARIIGANPPTNASSVGLSEAGHALPL